MPKEAFVQLMLNGEKTLPPDENYIQLEFDNMPLKNKIVEENEVAANRLEQMGFSISRLPSDVYPGMPYSSSGRLQQRQTILYARQYINRMGRKGRILSSIIGDSRIIAAKEIEHLLEIQREQSIEPRRGRRPGSKNKRQ